MANFRITLDLKYFEQLMRDRVNIDCLIQCDNLPKYPDFVDNLAKGMNTPAEELHHATTGIAGEAGEILDLSKKVWIYGKPLDVKHLIEELGDLRFYYQMALNLLGITDEQVIAQNIIKLRTRYSAGTYSDKEANERKDKTLSAEGSKGQGTPEPRKFMSDN